ncbi:MAG: bifunctional riboflavin kinase/FAD synthetase [Crocinitomicaceae bacterium]
MKVYYSLEEVPEIKNPVLTLGTYDGVHNGHQQIIDFLSKSAKRIGGETVLLTFHPHPRMVLHPNDHNLELIQDMDRRIESLAEAGIDHLILFPFTKEFSRQSATEFVRNTLVNSLNVKLLTIGYNHHFGRNREGNIDLLRELAPIYNFEVEEIPAFKLEDVNISSTKIRNALKEGDIQKANKYLGHIFRFKGTVVHGDKIGTQLGYPTANIGEIEATQLKPQAGVYAVKVKLDGRFHDAMMNIGTRPTVSAGLEQRLEVHIFDFDEDIYGSKIEIYFIDKIREEKSFKSKEDLIEQLGKDEVNCKRIFDKSTVRL